jgi:hypothetical protein
MAKGEVYEDGFGFEERCSQEHRGFVNWEQGVDWDDIFAAILLRDSGRLDLLKALQERLITVANEVVDVDTDTVETLLFHVA